MAFTATIDKKTVFGDERVIHYSITADGTSDEIDTGFDSVIAVTAAPKSMASSPYSISKNVLTAGTAAQGYISITGVASGDDLYITVYGR